LRKRGTPDVREGIEEVRMSPHWSAILSSKHVFCVILFAGGARKCADSGEGGL
jgi:hypothetical protein